MIYTSEKPASLGYSGVFSCKIQFAARPPVAREYVKYSSTHLYRLGVQAGFYSDAVVLD